MSPLPDMADAFGDCAEPMKFQRIDKSVKDFQAVNRIVDQGDFTGVVTPASQRMLMSKKEGERSWNWFMLFTTQKLTIGTEIQVADGHKYRVVKESPYNGSHREYEMTDEAIAQAAI